MSVAAALAMMLSASASASPELNGTAIANKAVVEATAEGRSLIFLTRSEYQDLCHRAVLPELARYKGKAICVVSDPIAESIQ
jgi:hypothetical protein